MLTTDPKVMAFLASVRILLIAIGTTMAANNLGGTTTYHVVMAASGCVMALGCAAWGVYATFMALLKGRAQGVQAGITLVTSGRALDTTGTPIPAQVPAKPVTLATASQIVKTFGPSLSEIPRA